jgi:hypothetical protein
MEPGCHEVHIPTGDWRTEYLGIQMKHAWRPVSPQHMEIQLKHSKTIFIDWESFHINDLCQDTLSISKLEGDSWRVSVSALRCGLGRWINRTPGGYTTVYIDGNPLHNCKLNLRTGTRQEIAKNHKLASNNTTGHAGISLRPAFGVPSRWVVKNTDGTTRFEETFPIPHGADPFSIPGHVVDYNLNIRRQLKNNNGLPPNTFT